MKRDGEPERKENILLLGGTADARVIADALAGRMNVAATLSLAGVLSKPPKLALPLRIGGFGGVDGLAEYIRENKITTLIDATHPYAAQMSRHAALAAEKTGVRRLAIWRQAWVAEAEDHWHGFDDWPSLMAAVPAGAKVFLAAGQDGMQALPERPDFDVMARALKRPNGLPSYVTLIEALPGKTMAEERDLFLENAITHILCKNSGGESSRAKLLAARDLGLPVMMINRPDAPPQPCFDNAESLLDAL